MKRRVKKFDKHVSRQGQSIVLFILPIFFLEMVNGYQNFPDAIMNVIRFVFERYFLFIMTVCFFYFLYVLFSILFLKKRHIAYLLSLTVIMVIAVIHFYKQQFLGTVLYANDFNILKSKGQQSDLTTFLTGKFDVWMILVFIAVFLLFAVWGWNVFKNSNSAKATRLERGFLAIFFGMLFSIYTLFPSVRYMVNTAGGIQMIENENENYRHAGVLLGLLNSERRFQSSMKYQDALELLLKEYQPVEPIVNLQEEPVDVISIMLEGNFPVEETYSDITFSSPVQPFFQTLQSQSLYSGHTIADTFGNGTGISEFNYLTGMSNKVFPQPYIAYESLSADYLPSAVTNMNQLNMNAMVNHDFDKSFYNREAVYTSMGFKQFNSIDEITQKLNIPAIATGEYMRDTVFFDYIKQELDNHSNESNYMFNITMQNHFPYPQSASDETIEILNAPSSYTDIQKENLRKIATGMKSTDTALKQFIAKLKASPKKTIVVIFGDHQPIINEQFVNQKRAEKDYYTHYAVWTNFSTKQEPVKKTMSISELGTTVQQLIDVDEQAVKALQGFYTYLEKNQLSYMQLAEYVAHDFYQNKQLEEMYTAFFTVHLYNYQGKNFNEKNQQTTAFLNDERKKYRSE